MSIKKFDFKPQLRFFKMLFTEKHLMVDNFYTFQNAILEKYPHGAKTSDSGLTKDFQQARLALWQIRSFCLIFDKNIFHLNIMNC